MRVIRKEPVAVEEVKALIGIKTQEEAIQSFFNLFETLWATDQLTDDAFEEMVDATITICENNKITIPVNYEGNRIAGEDFKDEEDDDE